MTGVKTGSFRELVQVRGLRASFLLVLLAFAGFALLLPVVPLSVVRAGGSGTLAGATTGVFMVTTVLVQLVTPRLTTQAGYRWTLAVGSALLGLPSVVLAATDEPWALLAVSAARGAGFGMMTVSGSALVAELAPAGMLGRATSLIGLAVGVSEALFLPAGLAVFDRFGIAPVATLASALGAVGLVAVARLPRVFPHQESAEDPANPLSRGQVIAALAAPFLVMLAVSLPYGAVASFLSPSLDSLQSGQGAVVAGLCLGLVGVAVVIGRTIAGHISDRRGPGLLVAPGLIAGGAGMAGIALLLAAQASTWLFLVPCLIFGLGFGALQNEALVGSFERLPRSRLGTASASWNISFDAGTGLGSLVMGMLVWRGNVVLFTVAAVIVLVVGLPAALNTRSRR